MGIHVFLRKARELRMVLRVCLLAGFLVLASASTGYKNLKCWWNRIPQVMDSLEGTDSRLDGFFRYRKDAVNKCFEVARDNGYAYFAVGGKGKCLATHSESAYKTYGSRSHCPSHGKGAYAVMNVYNVTTIEWCELGKRHTMCKYSGVDMEACGEVVSRTLSLDDMDEVLTAHNEARHKVA